MNQSSNFLGRRKSPQYSVEEKVNASILKDDFSSKTVKQNQLNFSSIEINKPPTAPVYSIS